MKKQLIILVLAVAAVVGITIFLVHHQKRSVLERLEEMARIPDSQLHQHVDPDGKIVEHIHTYETLATVAFVENEKDTDTKDYMKMSRIQRAWAQLDLAEIKEKWQPYNIAEMREKWFYKAMIMGMGPNFNYEEKWGEIDKEHPPDQWIQHYLDIGYPFHEHFHYRNALGHRWGLKRNRVRATESPKSRERVFRGVGLPPEATWEEYDDTYIKHEVLAALAFDKQHREDPNAAGGVFWVGSGVIPFKSDTVYVHVSDDGPVSHFIGPQLSRQQKDGLTMFGIAPKGMKVVYTDKSGIPLPPDVKPRFYERAMAQLDATEKQVAKQIADHDALFKTPENENGQKTKTIIADTQHNHPHPHEEADPTRTTQNPGTQQKTPPQVGENMQPPLPPEPPSPAEIQKMFEELILLHGGDLPKDLKALQDITKELEAIRKRGEEKLPKPPPRPPEQSAPPERPTPPETPSEQ